VRLPPLSSSCLQCTAPCMGGSRRRLALGVSTRSWVSRVEFLWEHVSRSVLAPRLPAHVTAHDAELEEQPLADYGIVAVPPPPDVMAAAPGRGGLW
jgi:hypothetical protein